MTRGFRAVITFSAVLLVLGSVLWLGCSVPLLESGPESLRHEFPHRIHVEDEGLDCSSCHLLDEETGHYQPTSLQTCMLCHEGIDEEKPPGQGAARFYDDSGEPLGPSFTDLSDEVIFSHVPHVESSDDCASCHGNVGETESIGVEVAMGMADCVSCHEDQQVSNDCAVCHREIRADQPPPSHRRNWMQVHGHDFDTATEKTCSWCHSGNRDVETCNGCHLVREPQNHTNQFRRRGHGLQAAIDRESCQTCHQTDFCSRCHESVQPTSHRASFGSPRNRHCLGCHLPLRNEPSCSVCHSATPSHTTLTPPMPVWHTPALNCRQCHRPGERLTHPDNGADCILCHRR